MQTFTRFLFEFMSVFFGGIGMIFKGFFLGLVQIFNVKEYAYIIQVYKNDFKVGEWVLVIAAIVVLVIMLALIILLFYFLIKKYLKFRKTLVEQESMLEEIGALNKEVATLVQ